MNIRNAAKLAGASVRTLRYYEEVGLIAPAREENGYRDYDGAAVQRVRLIRAYRELQFTLEEIKILLNAPRMERDQILEKHIETLETKRRQIENRIDLAHSLRMFGPERLTEIDFDTVDAQMEQSRKSLETNETWRRLSERMKKKSKESADAMAEELLQCLVQVANADEESLSQSVEALQACIEKHFYPCTAQILQAYAKAYGGDGLLAQALEEAGGPEASERLRIHLEHWLQSD